MRVKRGGHICAIYSTDAELAQTAARFLADGLSHRERCWYVASGNEDAQVRTSLADDGAHQLIAYEAARVTAGVVLRFQMSDSQ